MNVDMEDVSVQKFYNGIKITSKSPLYILANRDGYDFKYSKEFDNHYLNNQNIKPICKSADGITVIASVEYLEFKYFTNVSVLLNIDLDNNTMMNIYRTVTETIATVSWNVNALNTDEIYNEVGNYYNVIFIACKDSRKKALPFDISLFYQIKDLTQQTLIDSFEKLNQISQKESY